MGGLPEASALLASCVHVLRGNHIIMWLRAHSVHGYPTTRKLGRR